MCTKHQNCDRKKRSLGVERRCTPGHSWKNNCNDCFCTETGLAACTLRGCLTERRPFHELLRPHIPVIPINNDGVRYQPNKETPQLQNESTLNEN